MDLYKVLSITQEKLDNIGYKNALTVVEGVLYFRYDTQDSNPKEQWDNYIAVMENLKAIGFILEDPQTEHDCISGDLVRLQ